MGRGLQAGEQHCRSPGLGGGPQGPEAPLTPAGELPFHLHVEVLGLEDERRMAEPALEIGSKGQGGEAKGWPSPGAASPGARGCPPAASPPAGSPGTVAPAAPAPGPGYSQLPEALGVGGRGEAMSQGRTLPRAP